MEKAKKVEAANKEDLRVFYTALYHCFTSLYRYGEVTDAIADKTAKSTRPTASTTSIPYSLCGTPTAPYIRS